MWQVTYTRPHGGQWHFGVRAPDLPTAYTTTYKYIAEILCDPYYPHIPTHRIRITATPHPWDRIRASRPDHETSIHP
jgi:hypothetical protein